MNATTQDANLDVLVLAIALCNNSQAELARRIKRKPQEVWNWLNRDKQVPVDACPFIEQAVCDERVTCELLRPDYEGWAVLRSSTTKDGAASNQAA